MPAALMTVGSSSYTGRTCTTLLTKVVEQELPTGANCQVAWVGVCDVCQQM